MKPPRTAWNDFPDVVLHAQEPLVKKHAAYKAAKGGHPDAATWLVSDTLSQHAIETLRVLIGVRRPIIVSVTAYEISSINAIPDALAESLAQQLGLTADTSILQANAVGHTHASGFKRLANQAEFIGPVQVGSDYLMVDDFVGQGGTLANLKGYIESNGGQVIGATVLTGKPYSAKLTPTREMLAALRKKHGRELEQWWQDRFGHTFDLLTQSEARYLERTDSARTVRDRIAAAKQIGDPRAGS